MPNSYVIDIRHYLDEKGNLGTMPDPAKRLGVGGVDRSVGVGASDAQEPIDNSGLGGAKVVVVRRATVDTWLLPPPDAIPTNGNPTGRISSLSTSAEFHEKCRFVWAVATANDRAALPTVDRHPRDCGRAIAIPRIPQT